MDNQHNYVKITDYKIPDFGRALKPTVQMKSSGVVALVFGAIRFIRQCEARIGKESRSNPTEGTWIIRRHLKMLKLWIFMVLAVIIATGSDEIPKKRQKRRLDQFGFMIAYTTKRWATDYNGYGCWCGKGGSGKTVDGVDRCCKTHDLCYRKILRRFNHCSPYWEEYHYSQASRRRINCDTKYWHCDPRGERCSRRRSSACQMAVCKCDRNAAHCFARNTFHSKYRGYNKNRC